MKIKVNDTVRIKRADQNHSTHWDMFNKMQFTNNGKKPRYPSEGYKQRIYKVIAKEHCISNNYKVYGIEDEKGNQFVFRKKGLKRINN